MTEASETKPLLHKTMSSPVIPSKSADHLAEEGHAEHHHHKTNSEGTFLQRNIEVTNPENVKDKLLYEGLKKRFVSERKRWLGKAKLFRLANMFVTVIVVLIQVAQVVVFQIPVIPATERRAVATILPAITSSLLGLQLKLGWNEKAAKCKKSAHAYCGLINQVMYRLEMIEAGGKLEDTVNVWNNSLKMETSVPAFVIPY